LEHPDLNLTFPIVSGGTTGTSDDFLVQFREAFINNPFLDPKQLATNHCYQKPTASNSSKEIQNLQHKLSLTAAEGKKQGIAAVDA
jgi:hypothetical protein